MRVVLVAGEYPPMRGGLGDFTRELARGMAELGHAPHVLTLASPGSPVHAQADGVTVHRRMRAWGWGSRRTVETLAREVAADVVNIQYQAAAYRMHGAINLLPGQLTRALPTVVTFHDLRVPYLFPKAGALRWRAILWMARRANASIVTNAEDAAVLRQAGVPQTRMIPIGSNIDPTALRQFDRAAWCRERGIDPALKLVGYFGFLNESKGGATLVHALAELRARETAGQRHALLLIGDPLGSSDPTNARYRGDLQALIERLGLGERVFATGYLDPSGVSAAFACCDCLALPYRDGASFRRGTLMAGLAHGCAVVTTMPRVPIPEWANGTTALFVPPDDPVALADAITRITGDAALAVRLRSGSTAAAAAFRWDRIAADTIDLYESAIQSRPDHAHKDRLHHRPGE